VIDISFKNKTGIKPEILSAIIGADSFFYGLFSEEYKLLECQYYPISDFDDENIIEQVKFDIYNIQNLKIKVTSTSKPYLHSDVNSTEKLMKFFPSFLNKDTNENKFTDQDVVVDYGLTKSQSKFLSQILNGYSSNFHISTVLSNYYYPYSKKQLIAFVDNDKIHLLYGKDTKFIFYNQFDCKHENDYLYFVSLIYSELELDRNKDTLQLFGRVDIDSPIYKLLHGYIRNIEFMKSEKLVITDLRYRMNQHYYLDLFATALCE
jgi:hypothetical protein